MKTDTNTEKKQLRTEIYRIKKRLMKKQIYENFGQKEVRILEDKYRTSTIYSSYDERYPLAVMIHQFNNWCMNYTGSEN